MLTLPSLLRQPDYRSEVSRRALALNFNRDMNLALAYYPCLTSSFAYSIDADLRRLDTHQIWHQRNLYRERILQCESVP
jgi:hypothetical protein